MRLCKIENCDRSARTKGWCGTHYERWRKTGTTDPRSEHVPKTCVTEGCESVSRSNNMCNRHYENLRLRGNPVPQRDRPLLERIREIGWTLQESGCWEWKGRKNDSGYGMYNHKRVHRIMAEDTYGAIPKGHVVRHKCDNPPCINPSHLEIGTQSDNIQDTIKRGRRWEQNRTRCAKGHNLTDPGAITVTHRSNGRTERNCTACRRDRSRRWANKKRER